MRERSPPFDAAALSTLSSTEKRSNAALISIIAIYLFAVFLAVHHFSFDWPHNDDFGLIYLHKHFFADEPHNVFDMLLLHAGPHPIGFQIAIALLSFHLFGIHFIYLIWTEIGIVTITGVLFAVYARGLFSTALARFLAPIAIVAFSFHPVQTDHLTWAFEIGWFIINSIIYINLLLTEKFEFKSIPLIVLFSTLASISSAHGCVAWLCAALHYFLMRPPKVHAYKYICVFVCSFTFVLNVYVLSNIDDKTPAITSYAAFFQYFLSLLGAISGQRNYTVLLCGSIVLFAAILFGTSSLARSDRTAADRISATLYLASIVCVATFAKGRFRYGLPWALQDFHLGPMLVPLLIGLSLSCLQTYERSTVRVIKVICIGLLLFLVGTIPASIPYMLERGSNSLTRQAIAMHVVCNSGYSEYMIDNANIVSGFHELIMESVPYLTDLCTTKEPDTAILLEKEPTKFVEYSLKRPELTEALTALWEVYATHMDLVRAFPPREPGSADRLLEWARADALNGSQYDPKALLRYRTILQSL